MSVSTYYCLMAIFAAAATCANCGRSSSSSEERLRPLIVPRWSDFCIAGNDRLRSIEDACEEQYGLTQARTYFYPYVSAKEQKDIRCSENCIYEAFGVYPTPEHRLNTTASKTVLPEYSFDCLDECGTYMNNDHCMQSYCITQCIYGCVIDDLRWFRSHCVGHANRS